MTVYRSWHRSGPGTDCGPSWRVSVLECGDGVFGVAALGRVVSAESFGILSAARGRAVTLQTSSPSVQNVAEDSTGHGLGLIHSLIEQSHSIPGRSNQNDGTEWNGTSPGLMRANVYLAERRDGRAVGSLRSSSSLLPQSRTIAFQTTAIHKLWR